MATDIIDSSYTSLDSGNLLTSFFNWLFNGALNTPDGQIFGIGLILVVALVSFLTFKGFRYEKAFMPSAMITWIVSFLTLKAGWINNTVFFLTCVYVVVALYMLWDKSSQEEA